MASDNLFHISNWRLWHSYFEQRQTQGNLKKSARDFNTENKQINLFKLAKQRVKNKKERASISVFVCMVLVGLLTLWAVLLPAAQLNFLESQVADFAKLQAQQIMASYDRKLLERYGLLAFDKSKVNSEVLENLLGKRYQQYCFSAKIEANSRLVQPENLRKLILNYMRPRAPLALFVAARQRFQEFQSAFKELSTQTKGQLQTIANDAEMSFKQVDKIRAKLTEKLQDDADSKKLKQARSYKYKAKNGAISRVGSTIKNKLLELIGKGLLKALDQLSDGYAQFQELGHSSGIDSGIIEDFLKIGSELNSLLNRIESLNLPGMDELLINEYLVGFLSSAIRNQHVALPGSNLISTNQTWRQQSFQSLQFSSDYELETCCSFFKQKAAYLQAKVEIFCLRFGLQLWDCEKNSTNKFLYRSLALVLSTAAAILGLPINPEVFEHGFIAIEAGIKAFKDCQKLLAGEMLKLLPPTLLNGNSKFNIDHDYFDYMRLFLLFTSGEHKLSCFASILKQNQPGEFCLAVQLQLAWQRSRLVNSSGKFKRTYRMLEKLPELERS